MFVGIRVIWFCVIITRQTHGKMSAMVVGPRPHCIKMCKNNYLLYIPNKKSTKNRKFFNLDLT